MKLSIFGRGLGVVLVLLIVMAILGSACGPKEAPPPAPPPPPGGNQPPVISSLAAAEMAVYPNGNTEIQCDASDPNGDKIQFKWACTGDRQ